MKRCSVIGGSGFIGSHLTKLLVASGREVTVIGRSVAPVNLLPEGVVYLQGDYGNRAFLQTALLGADEVIDLAYSTVPKTSFDDPTHDILTNLPMSVGLFETAAASGVGRLVFVSSGGTVYGDARQTPIPEDAPTNPVSPYGITKLAIEKYAYLYSTLKGLPVICVRPSNAFGEGQLPFRGQGFISTSMASVINGQEIEIFGDQGTVRDYLYVEDMAHGIMSALESGKSGTCYNIGSGIGRTNIDILNAIMPLAKRYSKEIKLKRSPRRKFDVPVNILDCNRLHNETGWQPKTSFEEGIERTWQWMLAVNCNPPVQPK